MQETGPASEVTPPPPPPATASELQPGSPQVSLGVLCLARVARWFPGFARDSQSASQRGLPPPPPPPRPTHRGPSHSQRAPARLPPGKPWRVVFGHGCTLVCHPKPQGGPSTASELKTPARRKRQRASHSQTEPVSLGVLCVVMATCWFVLQLPRA